jgi:hypothetical protein
MLAITDHVTGFVYRSDPKSANKQAEAENLRLPYPR